MDYIMWTDVETTGLSYGMDTVLEVAVIVSPAIDPGVKLFQFTDHLHLAPEYVMGYRSGSNEIVQKMHDDSGLWRDMEIRYEKAYEHFGPGFATPGSDWQYADWDDRVSRFLRSMSSEFQNGEKIRIGGNSPHFDLRWLEQIMPQTFSYLHHSTVDVSGMQRNLEYMGITFDDDTQKPHRAFADVLLSIRDFQKIQSRMEFLSGVPISG